MAEDEDGAEPPDELILYWICKDLGLSPSEALEEDYTLVSRMRALASIYRALPRIRGLKGDAIHRIDPADARVMAWLIERGVLNG